MKKFITVLLSFVLYFNVFSQAHASAAEKWVVEKIVYESSAKMMNVTARSAISTAANNSLYNARVPVTASATGSTVATMIRLGVAGALIYGVVSAAGWIIQNGLVVKKKDTNTPDPSFQRVWIIANDKTLTFISESSAWSYYSSKNNKQLISIQTISDIVKFYKFGTGNSDYVMIQSIVNPTYDPNAKPPYEPVPDNELGTAINNSPNAPQILPDVYSPKNPVGGAAPEATSEALDNAPPLPETQPTGNTKPKPNVDTNGDGVPDTYDPTKPSVGEEFELPAFCEWATTMCAWYVKYQEDSKKTDTHRETEKSFWQEIKDSYADSKAKIKTAYDDAKEYFTKDRDDKDKDELDIPVPNTPQIDTDIGFGGACPADKTANINMGVGTIKMDFTYTHICTVASNIRAVVIFCGFFIGALIIGGIKQ